MAAPPAVSSWRPHFSLLSHIQEDRVNKPKRGRAPRCIILAPTRELANQVAKEFYTVCPSLKVRGGGRAC